MSIRDATVNEIIRRFDAVAYPGVVPEPVEEEPSESDRKLVERTFRVAKVLQVKIYDYAPNISRWILSTGFFSKLPKDSTTQGAIEESAANRLKQLRVVQFGGIPAPQRLMDHVFETVARSYGENRSKFIDRVIERSPGHFFRKTLFKVEAFIDKHIVDIVGIGILLFSITVSATLVVGALGYLITVGVVTVPLSGLVVNLAVLAWLVIYLLIGLLLVIRIDPSQVKARDKKLLDLQAAQKEKLARQVWMQLPPYRAGGNVICV